jgi:hypothetical protein
MKGLSADGRVPERGCNGCWGVDLHRARAEYAKVERTASRIALRIVAVMKIAKLLFSPSLF